MDKRGQLKKKGSLRGKQMRHSTIAKVTTVSADNLEVKEKDLPQKRSNRAKSVVLSKPSKSSDWRRSARGGFEKVGSSGRLESVQEDDYSGEELLEGEEAELRFERESRDEKERKFDSWLQEVMHEDEHEKKSPKRGLESKAKSLAALSKAESILGIGNGQEDETDDWLDGFLEKAYTKQPKKKGPEPMELDFSAAENAYDREDSSDFFPIPNAKSKQQQKPRPTLSAAAKAQSRRNLEMEQYIERELQHQTQHHHHKHDGHHGNTSRKTKSRMMTKPGMVARDTTVG